MKNALFPLAIASWEVMVRLRKGASNFVKVVSLAFVVLSIAQAAFAEAENTPPFELVTEYIRELGTLERLRSRAEEDTVGKSPQEIVPSLYQLWNGFTVGASIPNPNIK